MNLLNEHILNEHDTACEARLQPEGTPGHPLCRKQHSPWAALESEEKSHFCVAIKGAGQKPAAAGELS